MHKVNYSGQSVYGPSRALWQNCPVLEMILDPAVGVYFFDDFLDLPTGKYTVTQGHGHGTMVTTDYFGGAVLLDAVASTDTDGPEFQLGGTIGESFLPNNGGALWYEIRFKVSVIVNAADIFLGLNPTDLTIIAASAMHSTDYLGWKSVTNDGILLFCTCNTTEATTTGKTLVADTWTKLGFYYDPAKAKVRQFVDGAEVTSYYLADTYIPNTELRISGASQSGGTAVPTMTIDWIRAAQLRPA